MKIRSRRQCGNSDEVPRARRRHSAWLYVGAVQTLGFDLQAHEQPKRDCFAAKLTALPICGTVRPRWISCQ
jgi:hypothetical protein